MSQPGRTAPIPARLTPRLTILFIAAVAAAPTLASAFNSGFVADDWGFLRAASHGSSSWWVHGVDIRFRPIQAAIHGVMFESFGDHAAASLVVMAALEVTVALLLRRLLMRFVPERAASVVALIWAALPNRSAPRMWISATPVTVCVLLLLGAALAASAHPRRRIVATLLCCLAVLTYESGVLIGAMIIAWAWHDGGLARRDLVVRIARPGVAYAVVVLWNVLTSPKTPSTPAATRSAIDGLIGAGLTPAAFGVWGSLVGLAFFGLAVVGMRREPDRRTVFYCGALVALAGVLPLLAVGASPVVNGPVDRLNVIPMLGVAIMLGVGIDAFIGRFPPAALGAGTLGIGLMFGLVFGAAQIDDVTAVNRARSDANTTIAAFALLPNNLADRSLVLDPGVGHRGWYAFGWDSAKAAIELRNGRLVELRDPPAGHLEVQPGETVVRIEHGRVVAIGRHRPQ